MTLTTRTIFLLMLVLAPAGELVAQEASTAAPSAAATATPAAAATETASSPRRSWGGC